MSADTLADQLRGVEARANVGAIPLPLVPSPAQADAIRRAALVYALALTRMPGQLPAAHEPAEASAAEDLLELAPHEREALALYRATGQRASYFDRRAANWLFGHLVSAILGRPHDEAVVGPAAAWAITALGAY